MGDVLIVLIVKLQGISEIESALFIDIEGLL